MVNIYAVTAWMSTFASLYLGILSYRQYRVDEINKRWAFMSASIAFWSLFLGFMFKAKNAHDSLIYARILMAGASLIPVTFCHFTLSFIKPQETKENARELLPWYFVSFLIACLIPTSLFVKSSTYKPTVGCFYPDAGRLYILYILIYFALSGYACFQLWKATNTFLTGRRKNQGQYILFASIVGFLAGGTTFPLWYQINHPPWGVCFVWLYTFIIATAIRKYHLMDVRIAGARAGLLILVYVIVLGTPFWAGYALLGYGRWFYVLLLGMFLATLGPFLYNFLRKRAEDAILKEQKQYQKALLEISSSLLLIKELGHLLETIVVKILDIVNVAWAAVYLKDEKGERYILKYKGNGRVEADLPGDFLSDSDFIKRAATSRLPIIGEGINGLGVKVGLVIPCVVNDGMLGFLLLGDKPEDRAYTQDDVNVFTVLANQIALALENAGFIDEFQKTQSQLFATEQMASMGTMAGGMTHQINNRFHAIMMATSDTLDTLKFIDLEKMPEEIKNYLADVKYALTRVQENAKHGGKIANDFLNFSQPGRMQREAKEFDLREPIARAIEMVRLKTSFPEDKIEKLVPDESFRMEGNFVLLQDAFFNLLDNATDALKKRKEAMEKNALPAAEGYKGKIIIQMSKIDSMITVQFRDDGIGLTEEQKKKMFVPFFTTKATAAKGTGLGLYVIQRIVQAHHGQIKVDSEYGQGTTFTIVLPVSQNK